jgi:RES domain-containing protein
LTLRVFRIAPAAHASTRFSGDGGLVNASRWAPAGFRVVYTSESLALAQLEILVNYPSRDLVPPMAAAHADIPDAVSRIAIEPRTLPAEWRAPLDYPRELQDRGRAWLSAGRACLLRVPSAVSPTEWNWLLNPAHRDFARIRVSAPAPFAFDTRLR